MDTLIPLQRSVSWNCTIPSIQVYTYLSCKGFDKGNETLKKLKTRGMCCEFYTRNANRTLTRGSGMEKLFKFCLSSVVTSICSLHCCLRPRPHATFSFRIQKYFYPRVACSIRICPSTSIPNVSGFTLVLRTPQGNRGNRACPRQPS